MRNGWEIKKLNEICQFKSGTTISDKLEKSSGEILYAKVGDMTLPGNEKDILDSSRFVNRKDINPNQLIPVGSVIFPKRGGAIATNKKRRIVKPTIVDLNTMAVTPSNFLDSDFLFHWFQQLDLASISNGTSIPQINNYSFDDISISFPKSLPEQKRIVAILDEAFAAIDKAKANTEKNLQNAKELFESYVRNIFANNDWNKKPFSEICENLDSKRIPITENKRKKGDIPYYGASGVVDYVEDHIFNEDLLLVSEDGANLLMRTYPIAFSISGKTWVNNHAHVLRFKNLSSQKFIEYYLNSIKLDKWVSGMAQPKLNQKMLNSIPVPYPDDLNLHEKVVNQLDKLSTETENLETIYQEKLDDLEELKKSILQKAFNGELTEKEILV